jgi:hypothetical protein
VIELDPDTSESYERITACGNDHCVTSLLYTTAFSGTLRLQAMRLQAMHGTALASLTLWMFVCIVQKPLV